MSVLDIKNLNLSFRLEQGIFPALYDVSLSLKNGEIHALVGESGCGKTMTAMSIIKLLPKNAVITSGEVMYQNKNLLDLPNKEMQKIRGSEIALIPQDPMTSLNPLYTIGNQLAEVISKDKSLTKSQIISKAADVLDMVKIPDSKEKLEVYPHELSGGMKQRVIIAMALATNAKIIIADEPTTALDVTIQAQILDLINDLKKKRGLSCIFITHDLGVVAHMADRVAVMYAGKIVEYGTVDEIFFEPKHPYTWALLSSIPDINSKEKLESIPGTPPDMLYPPVGDAFALRSKYALDIDFKYEPPFFKVSDTHYAATWLLHKDAPVVAMPKIVEERIKNAKKIDEEMGYGKE